MNEGLVFLVTLCVLHEGLEGIDYLAVDAVLLVKVVVGVKQSVLHDELAPLEAVCQSVVVVVYHPQLQLVLLG